MKSGELIFWNAISICEIFKISWETGKHLLKGDSENHFEGPVIPFGAMVEYHPIPVRDRSRLHHFGKKVLPGIFLGCDCGGNLETKYSDCRFRRFGKTGRIRNLSSKNQRERSIGITKGRIIHIPSSGTAKLLEKFKANWESFNRQNQKMTLKPVPTSGRFKVTSSIVITLNLEFNSMCRRKKHSVFHCNTLM